MTTINNKNETSTKADFPTRARQINRPFFDEFVFWYALPKPEKIRMGIETQKDFASYNHCSEDTLTRWTDRPEFMPAVKALWKKWGKGRTPSIVQAIYNSAVSGGKEAPQAQKLWMQVIEDFNEKQSVTVTNEKKVVLGVGDIRYAIEQLPEPLRTKHYGYLRELAEDLVRVRNARDISDDSWNERPPETTLDEASDDI
jgi:hypothetical protein